MQAIKEAIKSQPDMVKKDQLHLNHASYQGSYQVPAWHGEKRSVSMQAIKDAAIKLLLWY